MKYRTFLLITIGLVQSACSDEIGSVNPKITKSAQKSIADKYYIRESVTSNPPYPLSDSTNSSDIYHDYIKAECILDDLRMFKSNGDLIYDNGATKCDPTEEQTVIGKWDFLTDSTYFRIYNGYAWDTLKILINDGLILKYENKMPPQNVYTWTETWKVQ